MNYLLRHPGSGSAACIGCAFRRRALGSALLLRGLSLGGLDFASKHHQGLHGLFKNGNQLRLGLAGDLGDLSEYFASLIY